MLSPGFAGCDAQTRPNATQGASRSQCEVQIEALSCKTLFFYGFWTQRLTLKITPTQVQKRSPWARQAMLFPCFAARLLGSFFGAESWFCRVWRPNAPKRHSRCISKPMRGAWSQCEVQTEALSCKTLFFYRFWTQRLTLKITPTQVQKRSPWARQAMLFPRFAARLLGSFFGAESWFCRVWRPNAPKRHSRCISKPMRGATWSQCEVQTEALSCKTLFFYRVLDATFDIEDHPNAGCKLKPMRGANWSPKLQNPLFL